MRDRFSFCRPSREPLTERHVQAVWYDRALRPGNLVTRNGYPVRVVHPGDWNLGPGPAFRGAVLYVGNRRLAGDVEVHLSPSGWRAHGHGDDPAYRNVVAHVTWGCGPIPDTLPDGAVSIWIGRFMTADPGFSPDQIDLGAYPFARLPVEMRPCHQLLKDDPGLADEALVAAGECRLMAKAERMKRLLAASAGGVSGRLQVFYSEMMGALGYSGNARAFRAVAKAVPLEVVMAEPENASAAFLVAAEFAGVESRGMRPCNFPEARLVAAGRLFARPETMKLVDAGDFSSAALRRIVRELSRGGLMGRGRAAALIANIVVPFAIAEGRQESVPEWLPPEDMCEPMRLMAFRLFGRDHNPARAYSSNGLKLQGLLHIYRDYCLQVHPDCQSCAFLQRQ
ncbi:MAG: DUF2851 family protein [Kiritimatiellae bacterium]|nr:DUF2851 family protein [Kiritimatiellia bacterium]